MKFVLVLSMLILAASAYQESAWSSMCPCGRIYLPVCASDGRTDNNPCEFRCRAEYFKQLYGGQLTVAREGRCEGDEFEE